jgi:hypothetical protein
MSRLYAPDLENHVEDYLVRLTMARGGVALKFRTPPRIGAPDRIVILPGPRIGWVETKRPKGGRYEPGQLRYHEMLRKLGCTVIVARSRPACDAALDTIAALPAMSAMPPYVLDAILG